MKSRFISNVLILPLAAVSILTISCDKDNNPQNPPADRTPVGTYEGRAQMAVLTPYETSGETPGLIGITARADGDSIYFDEFPVDEIIGNLPSGQKDEAPVLPFGKVSYRIAYATTAGKGKGYSILGLNAEPLVIAIPGAGEEDPATVIKVSIVSPKNGRYIYDGKRMNFGLGVKKVTIGETELPVNFSLDFKLTKKQAVI